METNLEREALTPYQVATQGSLWIWPAIGLMAAVLFGSFHFDSPAIKAIALSVYVIGVFVAVGIQAKKSGVQPSFATMPKPLRSNMYRFIIGCTLMAALAVAIAFATNFLIAGLVVGLGVTIAGTIYHLRSRSIVDGLLAAL